MTALTIKNLPEGLYLRLKQRAKQHRRSLNSEVIVCLEQSLMSTRIDPEALLVRLDRIRKRLNVTPLTDDLIASAKEEGRP